MEYLQYINIKVFYRIVFWSFKPYYKWNTFNTGYLSLGNGEPYKVLNLIINGIPSIHKKIKTSNSTDQSLCFKPYYKWNTFNTVYPAVSMLLERSFKPYYKWNTFNTKYWYDIHASKVLKSFKPYYKWNTFNTKG